MTVCTRRDRHPRFPAGRRSERGAVVIQVAVVLTLLLALSGLVIDYGVLMVARSDAQNAADAGAQAAATTLAFDALIDPEGAVDTTPEENARAAVALNRVLGVKLLPSQIDVSSSIFQSNCYVAGTPAPLIGRVKRCVTVKVYRDKAHSNPVPSFFMQLAGVGSQDVRAQAMASAAPANTLTCVWPIAIPDRWVENYPASIGTPWALGQHYTFQKYDETKPEHLATLSYTLQEELDEQPDAFYAPFPDNYSPPNWFVLGNGGFHLRLLEKVSDEVALNLTMGDVSPKPRIIDSNESLPVVVNRRLVTGTAVPGSFADNLNSCNGFPVHIGDSLTIDTSGSMSAAVSDANRRFNLDPGATWDASKLRVRSSCVNTNSCLGETLAPLLSPRVVAVPVFDIRQYAYDQDRAFHNLTTVTSVKVVNFVGLFLGQPGGAIPAKLVTYPGEIDTAATQIHYEAAFLRKGVLFR